VTGREYEAVAIGPGRIGRIEFQELGEQYGRDIGRAHRQTGMTGFCLLDGVHRQRANGICHVGVSNGRLLMTFEGRHGDRRRCFCIHGKGLFREGG
jgi:hypothetical protein